MLKMTVNSRGTTKTLRQSLPLAARPQNIKNGGKNLAWLEGFAPATGKPPIVTLLDPRGPNRDQRFNPVPKFVRYFPRVNFTHLGILIERPADVKLI
jgi:hypothetical protein